MEADVVALRLQLTSVRRLEYVNVTFCGDLQSVNGSLQQIKSALMESNWKQMYLGIYLQDIVKIAKVNGFVDELAKVFFFFFLPRR